MNRDKQIEEMANDLCDIDCKGMKCDSCDYYGCEYRMQAEALYNAGYRKASEVARNIFGNLRILGHIDFEGNMCIRKDSFEELEKIYTEEAE